MLSSLFRAFFSQTNQKAASVPHSAQGIDPSLLKLVAGGAPKGGWLGHEIEMASQAPKGGWR